MYQEQRKEVLFHTIHTLDITADLVSLSKLNSKGYSVEFGHGKAIFKKPDGVPPTEATLQNGMYILEFKEDGAVAAAWVVKSRDVAADKGT